MKISIRDRAFGHCLFSSNPMPPVNVAKHMEWDRTAPVTPNTVYTDAEIYWAPSGGIAWLIEPIHAHTDLYEILIAGIDSEWRFRSVRRVLDRPG
jgi:hypothetical protein